MACSGGPDSQALMHLLHRRTDLRLFACGVDHGLRGAEEVADELQRAASLAITLDIPFRRLRIDIGSSPPRGNRLAWARRVRYEALFAYQRQLGARLVAVGHHQDDNLETAVMQMLRGAPPRGMAAVQGVVVRPLLDWPRDLLLAYLSQHRIDYANDPSNADGSRLRTRVRAALLPLIVGEGSPLARRNRRALTALVARQMSEHRSRRGAASALLAGRCRAGGIDLRGLQLAAGEEGSRVLEESIEVWLHRSVASGSSTTAHFGGVVLGSRVSRRRQIVAPVLAAVRCGSSEQVRATVARRQVRSFARQRGPAEVLWLDAPQMAENTAFAPIALGRRAGSARLRFLGVGLRWQWYDSAARCPGWRSGNESIALAVNRLHLGPMATTQERLAHEWLIRPWRAGDRLNCLGTRGHTKVGDLFTNLKIPVPLRRHWPVLAKGSDVYWLAGLRKCAAALTQAASWAPSPLLILRLEGEMPWTWCYGS